MTNLSPKPKVGLKFKWLDAEWTITKVQCGCIYIQRKCQWLEETDLDILTFTRWFAIGKATL